MNSEILVVRFCLCSCSYVCGSVTFRGAEAALNHFMSLHALIQLCWRRRKSSVFSACFKRDAEGGVEWKLHLDEELSILLDVLVSRLLLLFLLRLHRHVDVHPQLLTAQQTRATSFSILLHHRHTFI